MKVKMTKAQRFLFYAAILLTNIAVMGELVLAPVIYQFYEEFYYNIAGVNFIVSGPTLIMVATSLLTPFLCKRMSKKNVLVIGGVLFSVGAVFGAWVPSIPYMIVMRILVGAGEGIVSVSSMALIAEVCVDEQIRGMLMGVNSSAMCIIGAVMSSLSGILSENGWQASFKLYWAAVVMVIFMVLFLPSIAPEEEVQATEKAQKKEACGKAFWLMLSIFALSNLAYAMITYYTSSYITENGIGGPTLAGFATSTTNLGGFVTGLLFGKLYQKLEKKTGLVSYLAGAVAVLVLVVFKTLPTAFAGCFVVGAAYGLLIPFAYAASSFMVPVSRIDDCMSYVTIAYSVPMFLATYFVTWLMQIMHTEMTTGTWPVACGIYVICTVLALATLHVKSVQEKEG